jgi:hypothetical protein
MEGKNLAVLEQPQNVQTESVLIIEQFLNDNYRLRRNMLSGKVEFKVRSEASTTNARSTVMWPITKPFPWWLREGKNKKREGDGRDTVHPSLASSPLYISVCDG